MIPTAAAKFLSDSPRVKRRSASLVIGAKFLSAIVLPLDILARRISQSVVSINRRLQASTSLQLANVLLFVVGAAALSFYLIPPVEYLPNGNRNSVRGRLVPPAGYNTERLLDLGDAFYDRVRPHAQQTNNSADDNIDRVIAEDGKPLPKIVDYTFGAYMGKGYFSAKSAEPLRAGQLVPFMESLGDDLPGVETYVSQMGLFQDGWGGSSRLIEVHVIGPDLVKLVKLAEQVRTRAVEVLPGASARPTPSLEMGKPELRVHPDRFRAAEAGLSNSDIGYTVDAFIDSAYADKYILDGEEIDLALVIKHDGADEPNLAQVPISTPDGTIVPLSSMADIELSSGLESIRRINRERAITINVTPPDGIALADAIQRIEDQIVTPLKESGELDGLYRIGMSGTADKLRDTWSALRMNFLIAVLITYLLMAALFESWSYPLVIMVSLPLAGVGGIIGLRVVGLFTLQHLDIITMLGFVILIGTVVNNAILIVHQALNYMRNDRLSPNDAVVRSVSTRIRPIFMTTITTTFGLLPLVLVNGAGSELYRGLGSVVLGGLLLSTVFTLFLVPSLFGLMHSFKSSMARRFGPPETELPQSPAPPTADVTVAQAS